MFSDFIISLRITRPQLFRHSGEIKGGGGGIRRLKFLITSENVFAYFTRKLVFSFVLFSPDAKEGLMSSRWVCQLSFDFTLCNSAVPRMA